LKRLFLIVSLGLVASVHAQKQQDFYYKTFRDFESRSSQELGLGNVMESSRVAHQKGAKVKERFKFAALVVNAFDKKSISESRYKYFAKEATSLLKVEELGVSPAYCYVVARLGLIHLGMTKFQLEAAKRFYESARTPVSANVYARVLSFDASLANRAKALDYALEAQAKQPDSVKLRWLVGGAYFAKADLTKGRQYWQSSIKEYEKALEIAKSGKDKDFTKEDLEMIKHYLSYAQRELAKFK